MPSSTVSSLSAGTLALDDLTVVQEAGGANKSTTGQALHDVVNVLSSGANLGPTDTTVVESNGTAYTLTTAQLYEGITALGTLSGTLVADDSLLVHSGGTAAQQVDFTLLANSLYDNDPGSTGWVIAGLVIGAAGVAQIGDQHGAGGNAGSGALLPYRYRTSSAAGTNTVSRISANPSYWWGHEISHSSLVHLEQTTKERAYVGLWDQQVHMSTTTAGTWTDEGQTHLGLKISGVGFRYSTSAGDTAWMFTSGSNGNFATYSTGVAPSTTTVQNLEFRLSGSDALDVYVDGTQVLDITMPGTIIPDNPSAQLRWSMGCATLGEAVPKYYSHARFLTAQRFY